MNMLQSLYPLVTMDNIQPTQERDHLLPPQHNEYSSIWYRHYVSTILSTININETNDITNHGSFWLYIYIDRWLDDRHRSHKHNIRETVHLVVPVYVAFGRHLSTEYGVESLVLTTGNIYSFIETYREVPIFNWLTLKIWNSLRPYVLQSSALCICRLQRASDYFTG